MNPIDLSAGAEVAQDELLESDSQLFTLDSGIYDATVKYVYFLTTQAGHPYANVVLDIKGIVKTFSLYIMYKDTGKPTKVEDGQVKTMPGYKQLNSLCYVITGLTVDKMSQDVKSVEIYNKEAQKPVPQNVQVLMDLVNKPVKVGIKKITKHKTCKVGDDYVPTTEVFTTNEVDKFYTIEGLTSQEKAKGITEPKKAEEWLTKYKGITFKEKVDSSKLIEATKAFNDVPASSTARAKSLFNAA